MQAASLLDGFSFDLFPPFENGLAAPEVDVSWRQVVQALVVSTVSVVPDELLDVLFELSWQVVVVQQNPVFHRAMISLDLALRHRVVRPAADMSDAVVLEPLAELARHVGWTVIAQHRGRCRTLTWFKPDPRSATCNVSDMSVADMVVHSFQARM